MKTASEWLQEFNLLYDNISSGKAPGLEPYEISVFLTNAQERIVVALYSGTLGDAFESKEAITSYLSPLVKQKKITAYTQPTGDDARLMHGVQSYVYELPDDLLFRTYESCSLNAGRKCNAEEAIVVPVTQDEFWRTYRNPFKGPNAHRVLRLAYSDALPESETSAEGSSDDTFNETKYSELVSKYKPNYYSVRYISYPEPIIIEDLPDGLSINGCDKAQPCKLNEALHQTILAEAVRMAKATWNA